MVYEKDSRFSWKTRKSLNSSSLLPPCHLHPQTETSQHRLLRIKQILTLKTTRTGLINSFQICCLTEGNVEEICEIRRWDWIHFASIAICIICKYLHFSYSVTLQEDWISFGKVEMFTASLTKMIFIWRGVFVLTKNIFLIPFTLHSSLCAPQPLHCYLPNKFLRISFHKFNLMIIPNICECETKSLKIAVSTAHRDEMGNSPVLCQVRVLLWSGSASRQASIHFYLNMKLYTNSSHYLSRDWSIGSEDLMGWRMHRRGE